MDLKLYGTESIPPVRAVLMCASYLGVELELVPIHILEFEHFSEDFLEKNPQGTIPLLENGDEFHLADSHAIMAYLVAEYEEEDESQESLYPKSNNNMRAIIDHRLYFDSGILFARGNSFARPLLFFGTQPTKEKVEAFKQALQVLETYLEKTGTCYIAADNVTIADFSIISTLTSFEMFASYKEFPHLSEYVERFQELPCYEANKDGLEKLETTFRHYMEAIANED